MFGSTAAHAQIVNGADSSARAPAAGMTHTADSSLREAIEALSAENLRRYMELVREARAGGEALPAAATVDFDDQVAPCGFIDTVPLRGLQQGAFFHAPQTRGGAILDGCSNFGVLPRSGANFLAFNREVLYAGGVRAAPPELIVFTPAVESVELAVSSGSTAPQTVILVAIGSGAAVDAELVTTTNDWTLHRLSSSDGRAFDAVLLVGGPDTLVVDDVHAE
jgi:hypothetical protein